MFVNISKISSNICQICLSIFAKYLPILAKISSNIRKNICKYLQNVSQCSQNMFVNIFKISANIRKISANHYSQIIPVNIRKISANIRKIYLPILAKLSTNIRINSRKICLPIFAQYVHLSIFAKYACNYLYKYLPIILIKTFRDKTFFSVLNIYVLF